MSFELNQSNPIELKHGSTWNQTFSWVQKTNNKPVDLTGCSVSMSFLETRSKDIILTISTNDSPNESITIDEPNGTITINLDTFVFDENKTYKTDMKVIFPGNVVRYTDSIFIKIKESIS